VPIVLLKLPLQLLGLVAALVSVPVVVNAPPVPSLVPKVDASPVKQMAGALPVGLEQSDPRLTGLPLASTNLRRVTVGTSRLSCGKAIKREDSRQFGSYPGNPGYNALEYQTLGTIIRAASSSTIGI
jgi:hypothetical protein